MSEIAAGFVRLPLDWAFAVIRVKAALQHEVPSAQIAFSWQVTVLQTFEQFNIQEASDRREMIVFTQDGGFLAFKDFVSISIYLKRQKLYSMNTV